MGLKTDFDDEDERIVRRPRTGFPTSTGMPSTALCQTTTAGN